MTNKLTPHWRPAVHRIWLSLLIVVTALVATACVPAPRQGPSVRPPLARPGQKPAVKPVVRPTLPPRQLPPQIPQNVPGLQIPVSQAAPIAMAQGIQAIWASYPDRAGVAVMRDDGSWLIGHRATEFMPQQSVSKLWVGIAVMQAVDDGRISLNDRVTVRDTDLTVFHQPIERQIGAEGLETSIGALLQSAMMSSDNTANDFLMRRVGGPSAIRNMLASKGLSGIRFGPGEPALQSLTAGMAWQPEYRFGTNFEKARALLPYEVRKDAMDRYLADPIDGATPAGIANALIRLHRGELLSPASTRYLISLMAASETGKQRLRGGVPLGWLFAHKTGTGQILLARATGYNDVGLMIAPDGTAYAVVVMIAETTKTIKERQTMMQGISSTVAANHSR